MRRRHHLIAVVLFTFGSLPALYAEDFVVAPGEPWPKQEEVSPGDRILFTPGAHPAKTLRGLRGTAEAPIMIDSVDLTQPAMFIGGDYSLDLIECAHLDVGTFLYFGSEVGGIRITGTPQQPSVGIRFHHGYIVKPGRDKTSRDGIVAKWVKDFTVEAMEIDAWGQAAFNISEANNLLIRNVKLSGTLESQFGVLLSENVRSAKIQKVAVLYASASAFQLGVDCFTAEKEPSRWALSDVQIGGCMAIECDLPIAVGSVEKLNIEHCTFFQPVSCAVAFRSSLPPFSPSRDVTFSGNLIVWEVGTLARFLCTPENTKSLSIGSNVWWSQEMPEGAGYLGPLPGEADQQQVYDVDPKIVERTLQPMNKAAEGYGHTSWRPQKTPPVSPPEDSQTPNSGDNPQGT